MRTTIFVNEVLSKLMPFMVRQAHHERQHQAHHERHQPTAVRPELVEGRYQALLKASALLVFAALATIPPAVKAQSFPPAQVRQGAAVYEANCTSCHGPRMKDPQWGIDLATFPRDQPQRFVNSVTEGVRNMPPWGDVLKADEIKALWAYLVEGEKGN